jgi:mannose-6-phosphate isomerase
VPEKGIDKGIFSIYILNIVEVKKYQGVFQGAGLLHAYLE